MTAQPCPECDSGAILAFQREKDGPWTKFGTQDGRPRSNALGDELVGAYRVRAVCCRACHRTVEQLGEALSDMRDVRDGLKAMQEARERGGMM